MRYKRDFLPFFTLRSHWIATYIQLYWRQSHDSRETFARVSHDSRYTFVRASHDCTTVVRHSRECLTTVARYSCERLTTVVRHSRECLTTFVRILISFIYRNSVSKWSYLCRIFVALCRLRKLHCDVFANVCEGLATGPRHMRWLGDGFAIIFVAQKSSTCLKLWRPVRDEFAMHARTLRYHANVSRRNRDSSQRFGESIRKPIANSSHPSEIGALLMSQKIFISLNVKIYLKRKRE